MTTSAKVQQSDYEFTFKLMQDANKNLNMPDVFHQDPWIIPCEIWAVLKNAPRNVEDSEWQQKTTKRTLVEIKKDEICCVWCAPLKTAVTFGDL